MVTYDGNVSIATRSKKIGMLDGNTWIDYRKDQTLLPDGSRIQYGYFQDWLFFENPGELDPSKMIPRDVYALPQYDWQDEMYRTAIRTAISSRSPAVRKTPNMPAVSVIPRSRDCCATMTTHA